MEPTKLQKPKLNAMTKALVPTAQATIDEGLCPVCNKKINGPEDFKDELSIKEYGISGLCQMCQYMIFG